MLNSNIKDIRELAEDTGYETYMQDLTIWMQSLLEDWNPKLLFSAILVFCTSLFGEDWWLIQCMLILLCLDTMLGMTSAIYRTRTLSGRRLHDGIIKFMAYAISIILVFLVQEIFNRTLPVTFPIMGIFAGYQSLTEMKSVIRHLEELNIKMPALLHKITNQGKEKLDEQIEQHLGENNDKQD